MKRLILLSAVFLFINSCSEESTLFDPTYFGDGFKGITFTAEDSPDPLKEDPTDWCTSYSNNFNKTMNDTDVTQISDLTPMGFGFYPAYPNPITIEGSTTIRYGLPESTHVYIYVVNSNYNKIAELVNREHTAGVYEVRLNANRIGTGVYRVIIETDHLYCKGDIWIKGSEN